MIGTYRINIVISGIVMVLTLLFSSQNNVFLTALLRSVYSFVIIFIATFVLRWILGFIFQPSSNHLANGAGTEEDNNKGLSIDLMTPDDQPVHEGLPKESSNGEGLDFQPITPPKLVSKDNTNIDLMTQALRSISDE